MTGRDPEALLKWALKICLSKTSHHSTCVVLQAWYTIDQMSTYYTGNVSAVVSNKKALTNLLQYHIVEGKAIRASALKDNMTLTMMNGEKVTIHVTDK